MSVLDEYVLELLFYLIAIIVSIVSVCVKKKKPNDNVTIIRSLSDPNVITPQRVMLNPDLRFRVSPQAEQNVRRYLAIHYPEYDERAEEENIRRFLTEYLWAVSEKREDLASFRSMCSTGVITELSQDIRTNKLVYHSVDVTNVTFASYETIGHETTILYVATVEYSAGEKNTQFIAQYELKYGRVIREASGDRASVKCPHCGAPVTAEDLATKTLCEFCGGLLNKEVQNREWAVVNIDRVSNRMKYMG